MHTHTPASVHVAGAYVDSNGNEWESASEALEEFLSDLPSLSDEETELVFQFTDRSASAAHNLAAIRYGVNYGGLSDRFEGDNYPVPVANPRGFAIRHTWPTGDTVGDGLIHAGTCSDTVARYTLEDALSTADSMREGNPGHVFEVVIHPSPLTPSL